MISESDFIGYDAISIAEQVRCGAWSSGEVLEAALARVAAVNPALNAVVELFAEKARRKVRTPDTGRPLWGVPFLLKDIGSSLAGTPTRRGSRFFADVIPATSAEHVDRLERAGLVIFGKSNTCELGLSLTCEPQLYGPTRNPWDPALTPGGSSGGAAAAVATGIVPVAHATDGFGSIRVPAACCGLVGFKPSRGRNTLAPGPGESMSGLASEHVVSRTVRDSAAILDATRGMGVGDPYTAPVPKRPFLDEVGRMQGRLRIAFSTGRGLGLNVDQVQVDAVLEVARLLADLDHDVEEIDPPVDPEEAWQLFLTIAAVNSKVILASHPSGCVCRPDDVEPVTWATARRANAISGETYLRAVQGAHALGRRMAHFLHVHDVLLTPILATSIPKLGWLDMTMDNVDEYWDRVFCFSPYSVWSNLTGQPAIVLPLQDRKKGPPGSVQLAGRYGEEGLLFRLAGQLEASRPWAQRRPADLPVPVPGPGSHQPRL